MTDGEEVGILVRNPATSACTPEEAVEYKFYFNIKSDPTKMDTNGDGLNDFEDPKKLHCYFTDEVKFAESNCSFKKLGTVSYLHSYSNELVTNFYITERKDIWVVQTSYGLQENVREIFNNNFDNSILILDLIPAEEDLISYQISDSWKYNDTMLMTGVVSLVKEYNDNLPNRERFKRTISGMVSEWIMHNVAYCLSLGISDSAKHIDLDENGDSGLPFQIP